VTNFARAHHDQPKILLGGDTRESTERIICTLAGYFQSQGVTWAQVGVMPTPAISYVFPQLGYDIAIDITASHNPSEDNGIKVLVPLNGAGSKLSDSDTAEIEDLIDKAPDEKFAPLAKLANSLYTEAEKQYVDHLTNHPMVKNADLSNLKIGIDCANGAAARIAPIVFAQLGAKTTVINQDDSYGTKINQDSGSTHLEGLIKLVKDEGLDFGVAYDGDADRCLLVDEQGNIVDGDQILVILQQYFQLPPNIAVTVMANQGMLMWAKENNVELTITDVGDANVAAAMQAQGISLGGEQSGHIILPGENTGDGTLTSLAVASAVASSGSSLAKLASQMSKFPQVIHNVSATAEQKKVFADSPEVKKLLEEYSEKLRSVNGRLLVRPSGTEPLIRVTIWGDNADEITNLSEALGEEIQELLT